MKFIEEARNWWKFASVRLAAIPAILSALLIANPSMAIGLIAFIPAGPVRYLVAGLVAVVAFAVPTLVRVIQFKPKGQTDAV
ncbi:hypothetical protein [Alteraurantiacibacter buctensis]|uniref:Uncharacterized protein n=1 Tax=Alteraurantiacibacter buctensis TaxID=1503981 RepID=A0A844YZ79_9SPHN|nr:hypothetical protein [Alteraurantiacibacter buctensis]MXO72859.1 hypothetical protein [Alteraurantiacibacter buctensis]